MPEMETGGIGDLGGTAGGTPRDSRQDASATLERGATGNRDAAEPGRKKPRKKGGKKLKGP